MTDTATFELFFKQNGVILRLFDQPYGHFVRDGEGLPAVAESDSFPERRFAFPVMVGIGSVEVVASICKKTVGKAGEQWHIDGRCIRSIGTGKTHQTKTKICFYHDDGLIQDEVAAVKLASRGRLLKVIIEACLLTEEEKVRACRLAKSAGADFVKTSTGFSKGGATVEDVKLMRKVVGTDCGVKAAGGIHTYEEAKAMIEAGANRIGASAGIAIVEGQNASH